MKIWRSRTHSIGSLGKVFGYGNVFKAVKFNLDLDRSAKLLFKNALVLSPHPDDDAFGLGGTLKKMTTAGTRVTACYLTDGSMGILENMEHRYNPKLIQIRKDEALKSAEILGLAETIFWGYRDSKLAAGQSAVQALASLIIKVSPDIIFIPSFFDDHPDHRATNELLYNATSNLPDDKLNFQVWAYEIWTPLFPNRFVDITLYIKTKQEAMAAHRSQMLSRRYSLAMTALNQYRAEINNIHGYTEAFFAAPLPLYKELYQKS